MKEEIISTPHNIYPERNQVLTVVLDIITSIKVCLSTLNQLTLATTFHGHKNWSSDSRYQQELCLGHMPPSLPQ